jgi:photosystem II stability/assembly factor-like uncharacterized protein
MARHPRRFPRPIATLASAWLALAAVDPARANGAFPDEFSIHFPPDAPHRIYVGANFGLLVSEDDGLTWRYTCEPWVVAGSNAALAFASVSFYQVTADGALLATAVDVTRSDDVACTWPTSTGSVTGQTVSHFFADPNDASFVLAIVVSPSGSSIVSFIVASHDGGKTFDAPHLYDTQDLLTGVEIARSKRGVVYATSTSPSGGPAKFLASADSGASWTPTALTLPFGTEPRILAVDPADEKKVYVRIVGAISDAIMMTENGGQTFEEILPPISGQLSSFLRATDGALYAGTRAGKLYVRPSGATAFLAPRDAPHFRCLGQRPGTTRIYACTDMVVDGYSLASSDDNGATFQPVMSFTQLLGLLTCPPVQTNCAAHWERIQGVLGIAKPDAGQPDGGGGGSPGSGGSHCASAGVEAWSLWLLVLLGWRRTRCP